MPTNNATNTILESSNFSITKPLQTCFCAKLSADIATVTGDATVITVPYNTTYFNIGSAFNTATYTFTAPVTGIYIFGFTLTYNNVPTPNASFAGIQTPTQLFDGNWMNASLIKTSTNLLSFNGISTIAMTAGDTAYVKSYLSGSTKTAGITSGDATIFWGYLIA